jgi:serine/threonine protein kinase/tetratricopeptide (TPR) repeat protein
MPMDLQRVQSVFQAVAELPPAERAAVLEQQCAGDAELRRCIEALLVAHDDSGELPTAHPERTGAYVPAVEVGQVFAGRYKLREKLGEGGMGVVFVADQTEPVQRRVALKIIRAGLDTQRLLARFEQERQALAVMDHPNIAKVFDAGIADRTPHAEREETPHAEREGYAGTPYFAMELVKGLPLTRYCDHARLSPRERLELFVPVCQAVQHAHQKGIIHRDLKPSNILVGLYDGRAMPKVIDFGVAKVTGPRLTEQSVYTEVGSIIGTLEYMSPEQAELNNLDIDTRSDIYALGVILYELLTGGVPFSRKELETAGLSEMLRVIKEKEPLKPSTKLSHSATLPSIAAQRHMEPRKLTALVRGELDWIVMKALEKDRGRRYETANGLAMDVQRYLAGEPVQAAPASQWYRLRKFARRHRGPVIAASLVLLALIAGVVGTTVGMLQADRATEAERQATQDALEQKRLAEQAADQERQAKVREALRADGEKKAKLEAERNLAFAKKANEILGAVFIGLNPKRIAESGRPLHDLLRENLGKAVKELEGSAIGDPLEVAAMQNTLGLSLLGLGEYTLAVEVFSKALLTQQAKLGPDHPDTLPAMNNLAWGYLVTGQPDKALPLFEETFKLTKAKLGPDHPDTLTTMNNLALCYKAAWQLGLALPLFEETLQLRRAKLGPYHPDTLLSMHNLAAGHQAAGELDKALPLFEETLRLMTATLGLDHPYALTTMHHLALCYHAAGKRDLALRLFEKTLELTKAKLGPDHPDTLASMQILAAGYDHAGELDRALPLYQETLKLMKAKLGPDHPNTLAAMSNLAAGYKEAGQLDKALPLYQETLELMKAKLGPDHPDILGSMNNLAMCYQVAKEFNKALPLYQEALKLMKEKLGPDHPDTLTTMNNLAMCYQEAGELALALPLLKETLELTKAKLGPDHPNTLGCMNNLAVAYWRLKRLDQSIPLFERTLQLQEKILGRQHPLTLMTVANLGVNYRDADRLKEAIPLLEEAYRASKKHPSLRWVARSLQDAYMRTGNARLADLLLEQLPEVRKTLPADGPELPRMLAQIGWGLLEQKRWAEAEPPLRECLTIRAKTQPDAWNTFNTQAMLGVALLGQKKYAEAEPLLLKGYEGMKAREQTIPPYSKKVLPETIDRLIELYTATNRPDEAKQWHAERAKYPSAKQ